MTDSRRGNDRGSHLPTMARWLAGSGGGRRSQKTARARSRGDESAQVPRGEDKKTEAIGYFEADTKSP
ncbi:hypothetical protein NL676_015093 [Syzygium grande]|nr:hypothetical protein NL676_015093 [Syzygium grande]